MNLKQTIKRQSLADIEQQAERVASMMSHIRTAMLHPATTKRAPNVSVVTVTDIGALLRGAIHGLHERAYLV